MRSPIAGAVYSGMADIQGLSQAPDMETGTRDRPWRYSMSRESVQRIREKDMCKQIPKACCVNPHSRDMLWIGRSYEIEMISSS
jgi:hypothetical protein